MLYKKVKKIKIYNQLAFIAAIFSIVAEIILKLETTFG